jgi:hypothetical protein
MYSHLACHLRQAVQIIGAEQEDGDAQAKGKQGDGTSSGSIA